MLQVKKPLRKVEDVKMAGAYNFQAKPDLKPSKKAKAVLKKKPKKK